MAWPLWTKAQRELQSRFAPLIAAEAQDILKKLTGGRYDRLLLDRDLSLSAGAAGGRHPHPWSGAAMEPETSCTWPCAWQ